jgi:Fe-S cluster biogenesis protein NfuA
MTEIVAYCGLVCRTCPIHSATLQENKEEQVRMRAEIVRLCHEH